MFKQYRARPAGIGFPCDDFAGQEPGEVGEIQAFCTANFGIEFPMFEKLNINSEPRHPLYVELIAAQPEATFPASSNFREKLAGYGCPPKQAADELWNFEKYSAFICIRNCFS